MKKAHFAGNIKGYLFLYQALRNLLFFLFLLPQAFGKLAVPVALQFRLVPVDAKDLGNILLVDLKRDDQDQVPVILEQNGK